MPATGTYSFAKETKNYWVYEPKGAGDLLGNLYIAKDALADKPEKVKIAVSPLKGKG